MKRTPVIYFADVYVNKKSRNITWWLINDLQVYAYDFYLKRCKAFNHHYNK